MAGIVRYDELVRDDRIHASLYTDPQIFADEMERIFHRGWVFVGHASEIPNPQHLSHIYDNRGRLETRVKMLQSGFRYSQEPPSPMRRLISNIEIAAGAGGEVVAESNFLLAELSIQAKHEMHWWAGRTTHRLRRVAGELRMCAKKVVLVNAAEPLPNLTFLI